MQYMRLGVSQAGDNIPRDDSANHLQQNSNQEI